MWNNYPGNQEYGGNQGYRNEEYGNSGYFPPPGGPPPPPAGFGFPSPDPYGGGPPPPMPPRPMSDGPGQMPSPGQYGGSDSYGGSPGSGDRGFGGSSGGFAGGLLNSALNKAASKAGVNLPSSFSPPAGPPPSSGYQPPSGPPPGGYGGGYDSGRDYGSGPNSVYNSYNGPSSNSPRPQEQRYNSFPYQQPGEAHRPPSQMQYYGPQMNTPGGEQQYQPSFMYSQCTGKKKGLIIGINYYGSDQELGGCVNDARNMRKFITQNYGYREEDIVMLTDDNHNPVQRPTRANIIRAMEWLVRNAQPNDSLFFHYSGHGGLTKDLDGDEDDGWDEVIYPVDYKETEHIVDDEMHEIMVRPLPAGCRLTAIFDSCHSGSALDLPYIYSTEGKIKEPNLYMEAGSSLLGAAQSYAKKDFGGVLKGVVGFAKVVSGSQSRAEEKTRKTKTSPADVISWSGCKDSQTSADTQVAGQGTGAMSWAFTESLKENPQQTYQQLLIAIRAKLKAKYSQKPQLSSSHPMDTNILFII